MESTYLRTLVEVVKSGSISKASDTLCVTQPAVSRRIKFMEEQYGHPLFDRSGNSLSLTDAGRVVMENAERLLKIERELLAGLDSLTAQHKISFSCTPAFGIAHLPTILKDFMLAYADFSDLKFIFNMPEKVVQGIHAGLFDLALIEHCICLDLAELTTFVLPGDEMIFVSAPSLAIPSPRATLEDLTGFNLYTRSEGCCSRTLLETNLRNISRELQDFRKLIVYDDLHVIIRLTLDGAGISFLSRDIVAEHLDRGRLREHRVDGFRHERQRTLVIPQGAPVRNPLLAGFIASIFSHFRLTVPPGF